MPTAYRTALNFYNSQQTFSQFIFDIHCLKKKSFPKSFISSSSFAMAYGFLLIHEVIAEETMTEADLLLNY